MFVEKEGYFGIADVGNGISNVAVVVPATRAAEIAADRSEFFDQWISERPHLAERFTTAVRIEPVRATGPFASFSKRAWTHGAALVGDAADFFDPFTGEGIFAAMRGAELLAESVGEGVNSSPRELDAALQNYAAKRNAVFRGKWKIERLVGAVIAAPWIFNRFALSLQRHRDMADLLVGVAGDFVPTREVFRPRFMMNLLLAATFNR
jgi:flavin-dependent dehydrogenase